MKTLTLDDLLPLDEFASRRREFFEAHGRYLDRYRRVRIGSNLTLLFENRQTLWFRLQEVLRIARLSEPTRVQQELDLYNRLLPRRQPLASGPAAQGGRCASVRGTRRVAGSARRRFVSAPRRPALSRQPV